MVKLKRDTVSADRLFSSPSLPLSLLLNINSVLSSILPTYDCHCFLLSFQMLSFTIPLLLLLLVVVKPWQSCPLTDHYLSRCHCGILTNGESYIKCDDHTLDRLPIFKRSFPYDELLLSNNNITNLTRSSFDQLKTIKRIDLHNNSLSFIDDDLLRLLGNYLEELTLTGDDHIRSLEFLTRYPLKKLRRLKLDRFNLSAINLEQLVQNMTKLEILSLRSCQLNYFPNLVNVQLLDLENNQLSNFVSLSTSYVYVNLANNALSSVVLQNNPQLITLNLSRNHLHEFVFFKQTNLNLIDLDLSHNFLASFELAHLNDNLLKLDLSSNRLLSINLNDMPRKLVNLSLKRNYLKQIKFSNKYASLSSLDLSQNQLRTIEKNSLFGRLHSLQLQENPLQCTCNLEWLKMLVSQHAKINGSTWTCHSIDIPSPFLTANIRCPSLTIPRIVTFNITYVQIASQKGLFVRWTIVDESKMIDSLQISISEPFFLSPKLPSNQTQIFLPDTIEAHRQYHICLILVHPHARDRYCREIFTDQLIVLMSNEIRRDTDDARSPSSNINLYLMLIGSSIGGLVTFLLIFTCCYLCFQLRKFNRKTKNPTSIYHPHVSCYSPQHHVDYPIYHSHSTSCPYHQENTSNSTDSSQIDASLSTSNSKHIYQTIDSQHYSSLRRQTELFDLWNQSLKQKR